MSLSLREQLSSLPVPRLTTVVRVNLTLKDEPYAFHKTAQIVLDWWNEKSRPYDVSIGPEEATLSFSQSDFKIEFARTEGSFALAMEEPDSGVIGRSWIVDVGLREVAGRTEFGLRASYRQPHNYTSSPEPRAPRFLREILDQVGATDELEVRPICQSVDPEGADILADLIESPLRRLPVIVISEEPQTGSIFTDSDRLSRFLAGTSHVFRIETMASWVLTQRWGPPLSVFQGAVRCYSPRFSREDDKFKHRLWLAEYIQRLDANSRNGFTNAVASNVFTQITAQFEAVPLLTPAMVRREMEEAAKQAIPPIAEIVSQPLVTVGQPLIDTVQTNILTAPEDLQTVAARLHIQELHDSNIELLARLARQEERSLKLESDLQEERAARALTESKLAEANDFAEMFEKENVRLEKQKAIAFGDVAEEPSEALRPIWMSFHGLFSAMDNVAAKFRRMERESGRIDELELELSQVNQDLLNRNATIESLSRRRTTLNGEEDTNQTLVRSQIAEMIPRLVKKQMYLVDILKCLEIAFPDRVSILESAYVSAQESSGFLYVDQAFDLLWRLGTSYWEEIESKGDVEARKQFGKSYSAKEKATLSKAGEERRTFGYGGKNIQMDRHLKIGTADNAADTLRIHFEWIAEDKRIVIGHCGKHLDF